MPLSNESKFGVNAMTDAINKLPVTPTIIRSLGIFKPEYLKTTSVAIEANGGVLSLVPSKPRGTPGEPVATGDRGTRNSFEMIHLPKDDVVRADDVQNVRSFGSDNKTQAVAEKVNDKLADMKADIEYTREHLMLGAIKGKILDADGTPLIDIYDRFKLTRKVFDWKLSSDASNVGKMIDDVVTFLNKKRGGEPVDGWTVICSPEFMQAVVYHKTITALYERFQDGKVYREGDTNVGFKHKNLEFIQYDHVFESGLQIEAGEAEIIPKGTRKTFREYFAPGDFSSAVNTTALPYYASREPLPHGKGWSLHAQSNPLPML
ncbi:MAG: major capsid protein, partial [Psychrobacter sp.]|nr:major capsid protein [Psychrobacter sp.]